LSHRRAGRASWGGPLSETLEKVCVETVEAGYMTRDLSVLIRPDQPWMNTQAFLAKLDENLQKAMN
jgi:isocitrate dehydrogenase